MAVFTSGYLSPPGVCTTGYASEYILFMFKFGYQREALFAKVSASVSCSPPSPSCAIKHTVFLQLPILYWPCGVQQFVLKILGSPDGVSYDIILLSTVWASPIVLAVIRPTPISRL